MNPSEATFNSPAAQQEVASELAEMSVEELLEMQATMEQMEQNGEAVAESEEAVVDEVTPSASGSTGRTSAEHNWGFTGAGEGGGSFHVAPFAYATLVPATVFAVWPGHSP